MGGGCTWDLLGIVERGGNIFDGIDGGHVGAGRP